MFNLFLQKSAFEIAVNAANIKRSGVVIRTNFQGLCERILYLFFETFISGKSQHLHPVANVKTN